MRDHEHAVLLRRVVDEADDVVRGNLIKTLVDRWPEETRSLLHDLVHVDGSARNREGVVRLLASRWPDERTRDVLRQVVIIDPERSVVRQAGWCLRQLRPDEALAWTHAQLRAPDPDVRARALSTLRTAWEDHPDTSTTLHAAVTADDEPDVRMVALSELGDLTEKDTAFRALAHDRLVHDGSPAVRYAAMRALDDTCEPDSFDPVRQAAADPDAAVRASAVRRLGVHGRSFNTDTAIEALYERVTTDEDPDVREAAWRALRGIHELTVGEQPKRWPDRPEAITWLREHVAADPFAASRHVAVDLLCDFVEDPDVRAVLHRVVEHHPDESDRVRVLSRFVISDRDDPDTREVTLRLAVTDPSSRVRAEVWRQLAFHVEDDDIAALMLRRSAEDSDSDLRAQLLVEIVDAAQYTEDRTATVAHLTTRAEHDPAPGVRQLAADLLADLASGKHIERREVGSSQDREDY